MLAYYIVGYRKNVVLENLRKSFPEKSEKEIGKIAKRFYLHLTDVFLESLYALRMGPEEVSLMEAAAIYIRGKNRSNPMVEPTISTMRFQRGKLRTKNCSIPSRVLPLDSS